MEQPHDELETYLVVHPTNRVGGLVLTPVMFVDIAPTYPISNQGCNPLTIRGMNHQVQFMIGLVKSQTMDFQVTPPVISSIFIFELLHLRQGLGLMSLFGDWFHITKTNICWR